MKMGDGNREEPGRKVQQKAYRRWRVGHPPGGGQAAQARVKRWSKSPPPDWQQDGHGKPPREQDQIGRRTAQAARVDPTEPAGRSLEVGGDIHPRGMTSRDRTRLTDPPWPPQGGHVFNILRGFHAARTPPDPRAHSRQSHSWALLSGGSPRGACAARVSGRAAHTPPGPRAHARQSRSWASFSGVPRCAKPSGPLAGKAGLRLVPGLGAPCRLDAPR